MTETQYKRHNSPPGSFWADQDRVNALIEFWAIGLSAGQIAARLGMGITRNAVISKVHRLRLPRRHPSVAARNISVANKGVRRMHRSSVPPKPVSPVQQALKADSLPLPPPSETDIPRVSFNDLNEDGKRHCKWPCLPDVSGVGQDAPMFCGAKSVPGLPYCKVHARRAYNLRPGGIMPATHVPSMM